MVTKIGVLNKNKVFKNKETYFLKNKIRKCKGDILFSISTRDFFL
jgi:hypothetical protein